MQLGIISKILITYNLLRNLVTAKVTSSGIVPNSGDGEEPVSTTTLGNTTLEITRLAGKQEKYSFNSFVIYGGKGNQTSPSNSLIKFQTRSEQCLCQHFSHFPTKTPPKANVARGYKPIMA